MNHSDFENQLLRYFYSELEGPERESFEAHLRDCKQCRAELENLKAVALGVNRTFESAGPRAEVANAIRARAGVSLSPKPKARSGWRFSFAGLAALILMATATTWFLVSGSAQKAYDTDRMENALENVEDELVAVEDLQAEDSSVDQMEPAVSAQPQASSEMDSLEQELDEIEGSLRGGIDL
jgi:hypothetical protein